MRASAWMIAVGLLVTGVDLAGDEMLPVSVRVELTDGKSIAGRQIEVGRGVVVDGQRVPTERIVRWDRFVGDRPGLGRPRPADDEVLLVGGDCLNCRVQSVDLEHLVVRWDGLSRTTVCRVPLERVRAVVLSPGVSRRQRQRLTTDRGARTADELWLRGGDHLLGELKSVGAETVILATAAGDRRVARESVAVLLVNPELQVKPKRASRHVRVAFADGSRLTAGWPVAAEGGLIRLVLAGIDVVKKDRAGIARVDVPVRVIRSMQYFGVQMLRLTRRKPVRAVHTPFVGAVRPPVVDGSIGGGPLVVGGRWSASGFGMTSRTRMTWTLDGRHRWFCARAAIDDTAGGGGDVVFRVLVDGRPVWSSGPVQGGQRPQTVGPVDLAGAEKLMLVVDYGRRADVGDHAVWLDPRLVGE